MGAMGAMELTLPQWLYYQSFRGSFRQRAASNPFSQYRSDERAVSRMERILDVTTFDHLFTLRYARFLKGDGELYGAELMKLALELFMYPFYNI